MTAADPASRKGGVIPVPYGLSSAMYVHAWSSDLCPPAEVPAQATGSVTARSPRHRAL